VQALRRRRDQPAAAAALERLEQAARDERENLMPYLLDAARAEVTEGEMVAALQNVFGSYTESPAF
jgi:methylmalonyl-CoA mutase N-terminal domain/subunit